ncbi:MAG TPA: hypothetical protein VFV38_34640 [Ktedonobacteraceae bacterium]|nr:hypothetical protein [Ktedonobacteraceae bacterium]
MVSSPRRQIALCPVCHRADQVKKMQAAYNAGALHVAPPPMPESHASMMKYICVGMALVGVGAFLTLVLLSANGFDFLPGNIAPVVSVIQAVVTILFIVAALLLSFLAIRSIGQGDEEARQRYPIWDEAMANWNRLRFCVRDHVIFDPSTDKVLSDSALKAQLDMDALEAQHTPVPVAASH